MSKPTHLAHDEGNINKYFHTLPNMYDDDLDPFEYRLIGHYKRVGVSWEGTRKVAEKCKMSVGMVSTARKSLAKKGLLKVEMLTRKQLKDRGLISDEKPDDKVEICVVTVVDVMKENIERYAKDEPVHVVNTPVHTVNTPVHVVNERRTIEEEPLKKGIAPAVAGEPPLRVVEKPVQKPAGKTRAKPDTVPSDKMNPMKEAIVAAFAWNSERMTPQEWGMVQAAARNLCKAGYAPADVQTIYNYCKAQKWGSDFKPTALSGNASAALKSRSPMNHAPPAASAETSLEADDWGINQFVRKPRKEVTNADEPAA